MKISGNTWALACLGIAVMAAPAAAAQQQPDSSNQYQGVSQPPPDDTIVATPDEPPPAATAKPSPAVPAPSPAPVASSQPSPAVTRTAHVAHDSSYDNTDYGIVTVGTPTDATFPTNDPVLHERETFNADADIVKPPPVPANELPVGTNINVRINDELSTTQTTVGTSFQGQVLADVKKGGSVIIPAGSTLRGRVVQVSQGHHLGPAATLRLRPDIVLLPDGTAYHLYAQVLESDAAGTRTDSEGGIQPSSHALKKTAEYGVGVGTGALVGGELAGPTGVLAGTLVGAGMVTTHLLLQHPTAAVVPAGSEVVFTLTEPMEMTPTRN